MRTRRILIVVADAHVSPRAVAEAIAEVQPLGSRPQPRTEVLIPAVLPATLPISACPPRIVARLTRLHDAAGRALESSGGPGRVEIVPCRSVPALLRAVTAADRLVLIGRAGWKVRRAARGVAPEVVVVPPGPAGRRPAPAHTHPQPLAD
jgi:hypothetical protein